MKKTVLILALLLVATCFASEQSVVVTIGGMFCEGCVNKVTQALNQVQGVKSAQVSLQPGSAAISFESDKTNSDELVKTITALGYKADLAPSTTAKTSDAAAGSGCAAAKQCTAAGTKAACAIDAKQAKNQQVSATKFGSAEIKEQEECPTVEKCKELIEFHEAMHPLHMALQAEDFNSIRAGYAVLSGKADSIKKMRCDETCVSNVRAFEEKRTAFLKTVEALGKACENDDNNVLADAFNLMHSAYIAMGQLAL